MSARVCAIEMAFPDVATRKPFSRKSFTFRENFSTRLNRNFTLSGGFNRECIAGMCRFGQRYTPTAINNNDHGMDLTHQEFVIEPET
jgi:hypothetical protein